MRRSVDRNTIFVCRLHCFPERIKPCLRLAIEVDDIRDFHFSHKEDFDGHGSSSFRPNSGVQTPTDVIGNDEPEDEGFSGDSRTLPAKDLARVL